MQHVGHESLELHVFHTSDQLREFEVFIGRISASFPQVVDQVSI